MNIFIRNDRELLNAGFSVFNNHVNNADVLARRIMKETCPDFLERIEELEKEGGGIMHIFNCYPEPATSVYVGMIMAFVW